MMASKDLLSSYCVAITSNTSSPLVLMMALWCRYHFYPYFADKEIEAYRGWQLTKCYMAGKWQSQNAVLPKTGARKFYTVGLMVLDWLRKTSIPPPWLFPHLCLLMMQLCSSFFGEVEPISHILKPGLAMWLVLANRMSWKWHYANSKLRFKGLQVLLFLRPLSNCCENKPGPACCRMRGTWNKRHKVTMPA